MNSLSLFLKRGVSASLLSLAIPCGAQSTPAMPQSGSYGSGVFYLVVKPQGIMGSFNDEIASGRFSCSFLLYSNGKSDAHGKYDVVTWWPYQELGMGISEPSVHGTLRFSGTDALLQLPADAHGGCWNVDAELDQGKEITLSRDAVGQDWLEPRIVRPPKLVLHKSPDQNDGAKAYVVQGDIVMVTQYQGAWAHVIYQKPGHGIPGWVEASGLLPFRQP